MIVKFGQHGKFFRDRAKIKYDMKTNVLTPYMNYELGNKSPWEIFRGSYSLNLSPLSCTRSFNKILSIFTYFFTCLIRFVYDWYPKISRINVMHNY